VIDTEALQRCALTYFKPSLKLSFLGETSYSLSTDHWLLGIVSLKLDVSVTKEVLVLYNAL
jgi:hypothetical protein